MSRRLSLPRILAATLAVLLISLAWRQVLASGRGLLSRDLQAPGDFRARFMAPIEATSVPGVVVAHGFAGSRQLMLGFGQALARTGYGVLLFDFDGHGASSGVLDREGDELQRNLAAAYELLAAQPEIDPSRIAVLGHSMGSGAAMTAAIDTPERYRATVAVSPTGAAVTPERPRNLLLMAGTLEPGFLANARRLLADAGGPNVDLSAGRGRALVEIRNVEHITILFSRAAHQAAVDWLSRAFGLPGAEIAPDRRMVWFVVQLGGWLLLWVALAPLLPAGPLSAAGRRPPWDRFGLPMGALVAAGVLAITGRVIDAGQLGGLLVGGALGVWFLALGAVWLGIGFRPSRPSVRDAMLGVLMFLFLSVAFGLMSQVVWLPWVLIPERLIRWPLVAAAVVPWLLAAALAQQSVRPAVRLAWWAAQSIVIVAGLGLTVALTPGLFFVVLLMPVIPVILAVLAIAGAALDRPWAVAWGSGLFFGWLLVAVFPLA